jgi:ComF family protein
MFNPLRFFGDLRDFVYPPVCLVCDQLVESGPVTVCARCWNSFPKASPADAVWQEVEGAMRISGAIDAFCACYLFEKEGSLQEVIHLLKYSGLKWAGVRLGCDLGDRIAGDSTICGADYIVPVPLHRTKKRDRGYNQSDLICRGVWERLRVPVLAKIVTRTKNTGSQTRLGKEERRRNVEGAFAVRRWAGDILRGKTIILVDDVVTTSATMVACASALRSAGAERIFATSIALAL